MRKTKIICTLGPSTDDPAILRRLVTHRPIMEAERMLDRKKNGNSEGIRVWIHSFTPSCAPCRAALLSSIKAIIPVAANNAASRLVRFFMCITSEEPMRCSAKSSRCFHRIISKGGPYEAKTLDGSDRGNSGSAGGTGSGSANCGSFRRTQNTH